MKTFNKYIGLVLAMPALALLFAACSESEDYYENGYKDNQIRFRLVEEADWNTTRSGAAVRLPNYDPIPVDGPNGKQLYVHTIVQKGIKNTNSTEELTRGVEITASTLSSFRVFGYQYDKDGQLTTPNFFYNKQVTRQADDSYTFAKALFWPSTSDRFSFFAVAPEPIEDYIQTGYWTNPGGKMNEWVVTGAYPNITFSDESHIGKPYFEYRFDANNDPTGQNDLVIAEAENVSAISGENAVTMKFRHALTKVKFTLGDNNPSGFVITCINFVGIPNIGRYTFGQGWSDWRINSPTNNWGDILPVAEQDNLDLPTNEGSGTSILTEDQTFYCIPKDFADDDEAYIEIIIRATNDDRSGSMYIPLKGQTWEAGQTVNYVISTSKVLTFRRLSIGDDDGCIREYVYYGSGNYDRTHIYHPWEIGEKAGLFGVNSDGDVVFANAPLTYKAGIDGEKYWLPEDDLEAVYPDNGGQYFVYYPYQETLSGAPEIGDNVGTNIDVQTFFLNALKEFELPHNLSSDPYDEDYGLYENGLFNCNFWAGKGNSENELNSIHASLDPFMTALTVNLRAKYMKTHTNYYRYTIDGYKTWMADKSELCMPSPLPVGILRSNSGMGQSYLIMVNTYSDNRTFSAAGENPWTYTVPDDDYNWNNHYTVISTPSITTNRVITPVEATTPVEETYVVEKGDLYYADGGLSHVCYLDREDKQIIGVVTEVGDNEYTESGTGSGYGGHGLVMPLADKAGAAFTNDETLASIDLEGIPNGTGEGKISGYRNTQAMKEFFTDTSKSPLLLSCLAGPGYTAPENTTGWFIASYDQAQTGLSIYNSDVYLNYERLHLNSWSTMFSRTPSGGMFSNYSIAVLTSSEESATATETLVLTRNSNNESIVRFATSSYCQGPTKLQSTSFDYNNGHSSAGRGSVALFLAF